MESTPTANPWESRSNNVETNLVKVGTINATPIEENKENRKIEIKSLAKNLANKNKVAIVNPNKFIRTIPKWSAKLPLIIPNKTIAIGKVLNIKAVWNSVNDKSVDILNIKADIEDKVNPTTNSPGTKPPKTIFHRLFLEEVMNRNT